MTAKENADLLMGVAMKHGITDPKELANFMGQMNVESGGFARMDENLNYSGEALMKTFPGRNGMDTMAEANKVAAGGPKAVAEEIYGGAWGAKKLGNTEPGDGYKFHGRGFVQLTGRENYEKVGREMGLDLVNHPELAADPDIAANIAVHYWESRVVPHDNQRDVTGATHDINGGEKGLAERKAAAAAWEKALDKGYAPGGPDALPTATPGGHRHGMNKEEATRVQTLLNSQGYRDSAGNPLATDGHVGKQTQRAIEQFQTDHHLKPDGVVGPATLKALQAAPAQSHDAPQPAASTTDRTASPLLSDPSHRAHDMFQQAVAGVQGVDAQYGRASGPHTGMIAGSLTSAAVAAGMDRIDHVALSTDASKAFAMQGSQDSPFKKIAEVDVVQASQTPLAQSSAEALKPVEPSPSVTATHPQQAQAPASPSMNA